MSPKSIQEPDRVEVPAGGTIMSSAVWGAPGAAPVLLLHGLPTNALLWRRIGPTLSAEGFRAFAPDLLGYGKSGEPASAKFGVADQTRYVHQFVAGLGLRDLIVVGHDIGGGIAQHLAISYPEIVMGLVLVNTVAEDNWPVRLVRILRSRPVATVSPAIDSVVGFTRALRWAMRSAASHPARLTKQVIEAYATPIANRGGLAWLALLVQDLTSEDTVGLTEKLAPLAMPKLVVWGAEDPYLKIESGRQFASSLPGCQFTEIPDCGHFVPEEEPFGLVEIVLPFLKQRLPEFAERTSERKRRTGELLKGDRPTPE